MIDNFLLSQSLYLGWSGRDQSSQSIKKNIRRALRVIGERQSSRRGGEGKPLWSNSDGDLSDAGHDVTKRKSILGSETADTKADDDKVIGACQEPKESHVDCSKQI